MSQSIDIFLENEQETEAVGRYLASAISAPAVVYLQGELGAGKTTLVRGLLRGLGHQGSTKSPTYTLVEPYNLAKFDCYHFDLYRLADPEELEFIGIREYQQQDAILLFEWPAQGQGMIPAADLILELEYQGQGRALTLCSKDSALLKNWNFNKDLWQNKD